MQEIGKFSYDYILTGYGYGKEHLEKAQTESSRSEWLFHSVIGNLERLFVIGSLIGAVEGVCLGVYSLAGRVRIVAAQTANNIGQRIFLCFLSSLGLRELHGTLRNLVTRLYPEATKKGICHGFALMGMQAIFLGQVDKFNERLEQLKTLRDLAFLEGKTSKEVVEVLKEKKDFDLLAFLEGLHLCMDGSRLYHHLFGSSMRFQHSENCTEAAISMVASKELEEKGEIIKINEDRIGLYTEGELASYFTSLRKALNAPPALQSPISILLGTQRAPHSITVGYDPVENNWIFIDVNSERMERVVDDNEIANKVMNGYRFNKGSGGRVAIAHAIYAMNSLGGRGPSKQSASKSLEIGELETKELNVVNISESRILSRIDPASDESADCLRLAVSRGRLAILKTLLQAGVNPNKKIKGMPILAIGIRMRNEETILALLKAGADLHAKDDKSGLSSFDLLCFRDYRKLLGNPEIKHRFIQAGRCLSNV
jgi:hypothetical protein